MPGFYEVDQTTGEMTAAKEIPSEVTEQIEAMDDAAIIQSMTTGLGSDVFIYRYTIKTNQGAKEIIGISAEGSYELANKVRNMEVLSDYRIDKDNDPDYIFAVVRVKNTATQVTLLGVGRQCKYVVGSGNMPVRDRMDEHAFVKAVTKAQRNGILHHADQGVIAEIIAYWSKTGKSRTLTPPATQVGPAKQQPAQQKPAAAAVKPTPAPAASPKPQQPAAGQPGPTIPIASTPAPASATPSAVPAATVPPADAIAEQTEKLKRLRVLVHNRFMTDLGINQDDRKKIIKETFKDRVPVPDSLADLSETDLNKMLSVAEDMIQKLVEKKAGTAPAPAPAAAQAQLTDEGAFASADEQKQMIATFFGKLTGKANLAMSLDDAKKFVGDRGYTKSVDIPKNKLKEMTEEADQLLAAKQVPTTF